MDDGHSIKSAVSSSTAVDTDAASTSSKARSLFDKLKRSSSKSRDLRGGIPGAFPGTPGSPPGLISPPRSGFGSGLAGGVGGRNTQTTKRVSFFALIYLGLSSHI